MPGAGKVPEMEHRDRNQSCSILFDSQRPPPDVCHNDCAVRNYHMFDEKEIEMNRFFIVIVLFTL